MKYLFIILFLFTASCHAQFSYLRGTSYPSFQISKEGPRIQFNKNFLPESYGTGAERNTATFRSAYGNEFTSMVFKRIFINNGDSAKFHFVIPIRDIYKDSNMVHKYVRIADSAGTYFELVDAIVGDSLSFILDSLEHYRKRIDTTYSQISALYDELNLVVYHSEYDDNEDIWNQAVSQLGITKDSVFLLSKYFSNADSLISIINVKPGSITLDADKINISGVITAINNDGTTTIDGDKLTTGTVTADQVRTSWVYAGNIQASQINAGFIGADRIEANSIDISKLNFVAIKSGEVLAAIEASEEGLTINADKINISGVITAINNDGTTTIDGDKLTTGTVIADSVRASWVYAGTVQASQIDVDNLSAISADLGTITGGSISLTTGGIETDYGNIKTDFGIISAGGGFQLSGEADGNRVLVSSVDGVINESSITSTQLGYLSGVTSNIQTQLNAKISSLETDYGNIGTDFGQVYAGGGFSLGSEASGSMVLISSSSQIIEESSSISVTELGYLDNVTSNIQTQLNGKASSSSVPVARGGEGAPAAGLGNANDTYYDATNGNHYLKTGGGWVQL